MPTPLTPPERARILSLYATGLSSDEVAVIVGRAASSVRNVTRKAGVSRSATAHLRKWFPDESVFDNAQDREEASYWVGFLLADGCVSSRRYTAGCQASIILQLAEIDRAHVERFAVFLGLPTTAVCYVPQHRAWKVSAVSQRIADALSQYGVTPRKTYTADPAILATNRHFWRGVVDGDGCIGTRIQRYRYSSAKVALFGLAGSRPTVLAFQSYVCSLLPRCRVIARQSNGSLGWAWQTSGSNARSLIRHLYESATIFLPRKYVIASEVISTFNEHGICTLWREETDKGLFPNAKRFLTYHGVTLPVVEWAKQLGMDINTLQSRLRYGWTVERAIEQPLRKW